MVLTTDVVICSAVNAEGVIRPDAMIRLVLLETALVIAKAWTAGVLNALMERALTPRSKTVSVAKAASVSLACALLHSLVQLLLMNAAHASTVAPAQKSMEKLCALALKATLAPTAKQSCVVAKSAVIAYIASTTRALQTIKQRRATLARFALKNHAMLERAWEIVFVLIMKNRVHLATPLQNQSADTASMDIISRTQTWSARIVTTATNRRCTMYV
jgi:hypothetical protein